jgi:hypothetical protein
MMQQGALKALRVTVAAARDTREHMKTMMMI